MRKFNELLIAIGDLFIEITLNLCNNCDYFSVDVTLSICFPSDTLIDLLMSLRKPETKVKLYQKFPYNHITRFTLCLNFPVMLIFPRLNSASRKEKLIFMQNINNTSFSQTPRKTVKNSLKYKSSCFLRRINLS